MSPFIVFAIILIVIWTLSGVATWINKQQEAERRRRAAMEFSREPVRPQIVVEEPRHISEGLAARYPQVLQPPQPMPPVRVVQAPPLPMPPIQRPPMQRAPMQRAPVQPPRRVTQPKRAAAQRAQLQQRQLRERQAQLAAEHEDAQPARSKSPLAPQTPETVEHAAPASPRADAATLGRWLRPGTLQQQFILTELFQPPLSLRDPESRV